MSFLIPIQEAGEVPEVTRSFTVSSGASLIVRSSAEVPAAALGSAEISGIGFNAGKAALVAVGELLRTVPGSATAKGLDHLDTAQGSLDTGEVFRPASSASADVYGDGAGGGALASFGASTALLHEALGALTSRADMAPVIAAAILHARGRIAYPVAGSAETRQAALLSITGSITVNEASEIEPGLASLDTGAVRSTEAMGSVEVREADGLEILVEIVDSILAGGHGDC